MNNFKIYIPSKGRANNCHTANLFKKYGIKFFIVVEPQDFEGYSKNYGSENIVMLDKNNGGLGYARNFIKKTSLKLGERYHWQFDDDIKNFRERIEGKNIVVNPIEIIKKIEEEVFKYSNIAVTGLRDAVFGWSQKEFKSINKNIASAVLINNSTKSEWGDKIIEDADYNLQCLLEGFSTVIFNTYLYEKYPNNKGAGGQQFQSYSELEINMVKKYPQWFKLRFDKKKNKYKLAPSRVWGKFKQQPIEN